LLFRKKGRDDGLLGPVKNRKDKTNRKRERKKKSKTFKLLFAIRQSMNV
jgi:hypothetical protein